jgi:hypothetical protein
MKARSELLLMANDGAEGDIHIEGDTLLMVPDSDAVAVSVKDVREFLSQVKALVELQMPAKPSRIERLDSRSHPTTLEPPPTIRPVKVILSSRQQYARAREIGGQRFSC